MTNYFKAFYNMTRATIKTQFNKSVELKQRAKDLYPEEHNANVTLNHMKNIDELLGEATTLEELETISEKVMTALKDNDEMEHTLRMLGR